MKFSVVVSKALTTLVIIIYLLPFVESQSILFIELAPATDAFHSFMVIHSLIVSEDEVEKGKGMGQKH